MTRKQKRDQYVRVRADSGQHKRILAVMAVLGLVAFLPVALQLYHLMVGQHEYYAKLALRNQTRSTSVTADRGTIYDRNMNILAQSVTVETVYLDPHELKQSKADIPSVSKTLAQLLQLDAGWIEKQAGDITKRYKQIAAGVPLETANQIRSYINQNNISGVHLEPSAKRVYPYSSLAAQVIGFTNASNTGSEGIEASYNSFLEGTAGKVITTKGNNEMDMPYSYEKFVASIPGCDVILTLDTTVQACLEKQMADAIARYDVQNGAFGMVMNAKTGEILAMATLGNYDPNQYMEIYDTAKAEQLQKLQMLYLAQPEGSEGYTSLKKEYQSLLHEARLKQWRNRVISDGYEPGSTFKVLTMAAALDCGAIDLNTSFYCRGAEQIPGRSQLLHCWRSTGHGSQKTPQALQNSCNLAFAHIALSLGGDRFYEYVEKFGVLEKTGVDLSGESKGVFFSKELVTDTDKWGTASLTSGSFGQTFKLTPLQLVRAIASVVNGGYLLEPYIVSEVVDSNGNTVLHQEPTVMRKVISEETSKTMCSLIASVVAEGTAKNAKVAGFSIGGKTGTSEKIDVLDDNGKPTLDKIVSFVGIAPMEDPEYIVLVALDTPSRSTGMYISGGVMAAPTVGAVMADILPYLGVRQNYTQEDAAGQVFVLDDLTGMTPKEAEKLLSQQYLTVRTVGNGETVTGQLPAAGESIAGGGQVLLYLGEEISQQEIVVPEFIGMNRQQANDAALSAGLNILISGNDGLEPNITVTKQDPAPGETVPLGTTVRLEFTDTKAAD